MDTSKFPKKINDAIAEGKSKTGGGGEAHYTTPEEADSEAKKQKRKVYRQKPVDPGDTQDGNNVVFSVRNKDRSGG